MNWLRELRIKQRRKMSKAWIIVVLGIVVMALLGVYVLIRNKDHAQVDIIKNGASSVVPSEDTLITNLSDSGYQVEEYDNIYDLQVEGNRVYAQKGERFIDICYNISEKDVMTVFFLFDSKYRDSDYYILAQNENYVYCVSDKKTFKKSGFTSTDNIGIQYIHE